METAGFKNGEERSILKRVEQLETVHRRWRLFAVVLVLLAIGSVWALSLPGASAGDDEPAMYEVRGLVLVDGQGNARATWTVTDEGDVVLMMDDARQNTRLALLVDKGGHAELALLDAKGNARVSLATAAGETVLAFFDSRGNARLGANVGDASSAFLLNDAKGKTRAMWSVTSAAGISKAELGFYDASSRRRLALLSTTDGTPAIVFLNKSDPLGVLGGWYAHASTITKISKGSLPTALGR